MEQRLEELFPDQIVQLKDYHSFVNQPERIQITSQQDISDYDPVSFTSFFNFKVRLPRPALNVKSLQLARASIPNAIPNIPDSETVFWYYALPPVAPATIRLDNAGAPGDLLYTVNKDGICFDINGSDLSGARVYFWTQDLSGGFDSVVNGFYTYNAQTAAGEVATACYAPNGDIDYWITYTQEPQPYIASAYLRYIRLLPSTVAPDLTPNNGYGFNRTFQDYDDFVLELNNATTNDPLNGEPENQLVGEFQFVPNDISFSYNPIFNKIMMTGLNQTIFTYCPAASEDPNWFAAQLELRQRDIQVDPFNILGSIEVATPEPIPGRNLNMRCGFSYVQYGSPINFTNMLRPRPPYIQSPPNLGNFTLYDHLAPAYPDLCYSACCFIYTDITGGATVDSLVNKALLGTIPMNTPNLGVGFHSLPLNNPLTKITSQIYEIYVELRTDTGAPFYLPNNAIVSLELVLTY